MSTFEISSSNFSDIKIKSDEVIARNFGSDIVSGANNRYSLADAKTNFLSGVASLDLSTLSLHQNFFWCADNVEFDFPESQPFTGSASGTEERSLSSKYWNKWNKQKYAWKQESAMSVASFIYLICHYPDYYLGMTCGRLCCARSIANKAKLYRKVPNFSLDIDSTYLFNNSMTNNNRFSSSNSSLTTPSTDNPTVLLSSITNLKTISSKNRNALYYSLSDGTCKKIDLSKDPLVTLELKNSTNLIKNYFDKQPFKTQIIKNYNLRWTEKSKNDLQNVSRNVEYDGNNDGGKGQSYFRNIGKMIKQIAKDGDTSSSNHWDYHYELGDSFLIRANSLVDSSSQIIIPIASTTSEQTFIITPYAGVVSINSSGNISEKTDRNGLTHLRSACLDLATTERQIAFLGVGMRYPSSDFSSTEIPSFDPYDGNNYYSYLKISRNENLTTPNFYLSADAGAEGEESDLIDTGILCTDLDIKSKSSFKSNRMKFIDFDKNGNLFILTDTGRILYFKATQLLSKTSGKIVPNFLDISGINYSQDSIDYFSCGEGIVVRRKSDAKLFYLTEDEVDNYLSDPVAAVGTSWHACSKSLKATNFSLTNDGVLFVFDGSNIYSLEKTSFQVSINNSLIKLGAAKTEANGLITISNNEKYLALLCHLVLGNALSTNTIYFGNTLPAENINYSFVSDISSAKTWLSNFSNFFNGSPPLKSLPKNFWKESYVKTVRKAFDQIRVDYSSARTELGTDLSKAKEDFLKDLHKFEVTYLNNNTAFKISTFQQKMQNLERLLVGKNSDELISLITDLSSDESFAFGTTKFSDLNDILTSEIDKDSVVGRVENNNVAKATAIRTWIDKNKASMLSLTIPVPQELLDSWSATLIGLEGGFYSTSSSSDEKSPKTISQNIKSYLAIIGDVSKPTSGLISQTMLMDSDYAVIAGAFVDIVDNCKNYMSSTELQTLKTSLIFLDNKFDLSTSESFVAALTDALKISKRPNLKGLFSELIISEFKILYNTSFLISQFKIMTVKLSDNKALQALESLKSIVKDKALFEPLSTSQETTIGKGLAKDKATFITYLTSLIDANFVLKKYQETVIDKNSDDKSFAYWIQKLRAPAEVNDYVYLLQGLSQRSDSADNAEIASNILSVLKSELFKTKLSPQNITAINAAISFFGQKGIMSLGSQLSATGLGVTKDFKTFLKNQKIIIINPSNLDPDSNFFDSGKRTELLSFWNQLSRSTEYNPNFNDEFQKNRYLSMLFFVLKSLELSISNSLESDPEIVAIKQAKLDVSAEIEKQLPRKNIASNKVL